MDDPTSAPQPCWPSPGREQAILRAVAAGRGELVDGVDLYVDGRHCCDQSAAYRLVRTRCVEPAVAGGGRVPAVVTMAGWALMSRSGARRPAGSGRPGDCAGEAPVGSAGAAPRIDAVITHADALPELPRQRS